MAQVNVSIAGRQYRMACDDGEEKHLEGLAARLDAKIAELRGHFGEIGDQRMTVMAALTIADDLSHAEKRIAAFERQIEALGEDRLSAQARATEADDAVALSIEEVARRVEQIARHLDGLRGD